MALYDKTWGSPYSSKNETSSIMGSLLNVPDDSQFTLENIPFGVFSTREDASPRCATAIGDYAVDLRALSQTGSFQDESVNAALSQPTLNTFAALPSRTRTAVRAQIISAAKDDKIPASALHKLTAVKMHLPMAIPGYTDFFCSLEHCTNCMPMSGGKIHDNFFIQPSAYNGRASSVIPSPSQVRRPRGIYWKPDVREPTYGPSQFVDFELEMGYFVSKPVPYGETLNIDDAPDHIFGFVVLNDWSSRDIQAFEMPPLGPFNSKSFGTTISPWIITLDALKAFQSAPKHETKPFEHLRFKDFEHGTFDIKLAAHLERNGKRHKICTSNLQYLYWTPYQQITQHASAGCGLRVGDLIGTGTVSGDAVDDSGKKIELACLYEATFHASKPLEFDEEVKLGYLEDGDSIVLSAWCEGSIGQRALGFGECRGKLVGTDEPIT